MNTALYPSSSAWPSAGRSLGMLIGVGAVLWLWFQLPAWYRAGHSSAEAGQWLSSVVYSPWLLVLLVLGGNAVVAVATTAPMWQLTRSIELRGLRGAFVFGLALLFHLVVGGGGLLTLLLTSGYWSALFQAY